MHVRRSRRISGVAAPPSAAGPTDQMSPRTRSSRPHSRDPVTGHFSPKARPLTAPPPPLPEHALAQFYGPLKRPFFQTQEEVVSQLPSFEALLTAEDVGLWLTTPACPDLFSSKDRTPEQQRRWGVPSNQVVSVMELRYGPILDYLGLLTAGFHHRTTTLSSNCGQTRRGRDAFLRVPDSSSSTASTASIPSCSYHDPHLHQAEPQQVVSLDVNRKACITLDLKAAPPGPPGAGVGHGAGTPSSSFQHGGGEREQKKHLSAVWLSRTSGYYCVRIAERKMPGRANESSGLFKLERAHRIVLWCMFGPPPCEEWSVAVHMCGNPSCLNPEHLVWGDYKTNLIRDANRARQAFEALLKAQGRLPRSHDGNGES